MPELILLIGNQIINRLFEGVPAILSNFEQKVLKMPNELMQNFHTEFDYESGKTIYECKYCPITYSHKNVTKMRKHLREKCPGNGNRSLSSKFQVQEVNSRFCDQDPEASTLMSSNTISSTRPRSRSSTSAVSCISYTDFNSASGIDSVEIIPVDSKDENACFDSGCSSRNHTSEYYESDSDETPDPVKRQRTQDKFVGCTSKDEQIFLQEKLAKAIYTSKSPFSLVDNEDWLEFFARVNPTFKPPTSKALATTLLDKCYNDMKEKVDTFVRGSRGVLSIQVNGWTDIMQRSTLNFIINTPRPVLEFLETKYSYYTAEDITNGIKRIIEKYTLTTENFTGIITNNASTMIEATEPLLKDYPALIRTTCFACSLNILMDDILKVKSVADLFMFVTLITTVVRNSLIIRTQFVNICDDQNLMIPFVLPCVTRRSSYCQALEHMIALKACLQLLAVDSLELKKVDDEHFKENKPKVADMVLNEQFWDKLEKCLNVIKPIVDVIMKIETDEPNIHKIYPLFCDIEAAFPETILDSLLVADECELMCEKFRNQKEQFVKPLYVTAYLLDPDHDMTLVSPDQNIDATEFINMLCEKLGMNDDDIGEVLAEFINYKSKTGIFLKSYLWKIKNKVSPIQWWENIPCKLSPIALRILSVPATSIATERSFSFMKDVQQKKTNFSTIERVRKLTYVSFNNPIIVSSCQ